MKTLNINHSKVLSIIAGISLISTAVQANVVYSDDFSDNNYDGWFLTYDDAFNSLDASNGYLRLSDTDTTDNAFSAVASFPAVNMLTVGTKVTLTLEFQSFEDDPYARGLTIGLYDSAGTPITTNAVDQGAGADDSGWYLYTRRSPALFRLYENDGHGVTYQSGAARADNATDQFGYADGIWHTFRMEIQTLADLPGDIYTNTEDFGLDEMVTVTCDAGLPTETTVNYRDLFGLITNFDEVAVQSMKGLDFGIRNVVVDAVIPTLPSFSISSIQNDSGNAVITWETDPLDGSNGISYVVETATNLSTPDWLPVSTNTPASTDPEGYATSYTNAVTTDAATFFRIHKVNP